MNKVYSRLMSSKALCLTSSLRQLLDCGNSKVATGAIPRGFLGSAPTKCLPDCAQHIVWDRSFHEDAVRQKQSCNNETIHGSHPFCRPAWQLIDLFPSCDCGSGACRETNTHANAFVGYVRVIDATVVPQSLLDMPEPFPRRNSDTEVLEARIRRWDVREGDLRDCTGTCRDRNCF